MPLVQLWARNQAAEDNSSRGSGGRARARNRGALFCAATRAPTPWTTDLISPIPMSPGPQLEPLYDHHKGDLGVWHVLAISP